MEQEVDPILKQLNKEQSDPILDKLNGVKKKDSSNGSLSSSEGSEPSADAPTAEKESKSWLESISDWVGDAFTQSGWRNQIKTNKLKSEQEAQKAEQKLIDFYEKQRSKPKEYEEQPDYYTEEDINARITSGELTQEDANILRAEQNKIKTQDPNFLAEQKAMDKKDEQDAQMAKSQKQFNEVIDWYRGFAAENGQLDRVNYLTRKAQVQADSEGKAPNYFTEGTSAIPQNEYGLQLYEEAMNTKAAALGAASKRLFSDDKVKEKVTRLRVLYDAITDLQGKDDKGWNYSESVDEYNQLLQDEDVQKYIQIGEDYNGLADAEKDLYREFSDVYDKRVNDLVQQRAIDDAFASGDKGAFSGAISQIGRGLLKFGGDIAKAPAEFDVDNEYGPADKWRDLVDDFVDNASKGFNIPSSYNKPMFETDELGERKMNYDLIIPKTARTITDMASLLYGAGKVAKGAKVLGIGENAASKIGLITSSFLQTTDDYRKDGLARGLNPEQAGEFAMASAALTSALELVSPNYNFWRPKKSDLVESVVKSIKNGKSVGEAVKNGFIDIAKEVPKENLQEMLQNFGDKVVQGVTNEVTGRNVFEFDKDQMVNEALETIVLTTLATGAIGGVKASADVATRNQAYKEAIEIAAQNPDKYLPVLQEAFKESKTDPEYAKRVVSEIKKGSIVPENPKTDDKTNSDKGKWQYVAQTEEAKKEAQGDTVSEATQEVDQVESHEAQPSTETLNKTTESSSERSILNMDTDLLGNPKKPWMKTERQQIAELGTKQSLIEALKKAKAPQRLIDTINGAAFVEKTNGASIDEVGSYPIAKNNIALTTFGKLLYNDSTIIHEAVHLATMTALSRYEQSKLPDHAEFLKGMSDFTPKQMEAAEYLDGVFQGAKKNSAFKEVADYGYTDLGEFVAEFIANKKFRNRVARNIGMDTSGINKFLARIFEFIETITGFKINKGLADLTKINEEIENLYDGRNKTINYAIGSKASSSYIEAIDSGRMTANDAIEIIKSAGIEVPKFIMERADPKRNESTTENTKAIIPSYDFKALSETAQTPENKRTFEALGKIQQSLSKLSPDLKVVFFQNNKEGKKLLEDLGHDPSESEDFNGFYDANNNVIAINTETAESNTPFHEAFHPVVQALKVKQPELFERFEKEAGDILNPEGQRYSDIMESNEESLVEFLADVADGKFDKQPSIIDRAKEFIRQILSAIGINTDLNLDDVKSLRNLADQLATAIREGRTIGLVNPNEKRNRVRRQKRKVNKTAKRIAKNAFTDFKQLQADILANPDKYSYTPQKLTAKKADLSRMSMGDVAKDQTIDQLLNGLNGNNQFAVLSAIELMRRYNTQGHDTKPIFKKLREAGTSIGQLLRQFAELKERTPEGVVQTIVGNLESMGLQMTPDQLKQAESLAKDYIQAVDKKEVAREKFLQDSTDANKKALDKEIDELSKRVESLNKFVSQVTPIGLDRLFTTLLQGNLLVPKSIVTNVVSNLINVTKYPERMVGSLAVYLNDRFKKREINAGELFYGNTLNGLSQFFITWPKAVKNAFTGKVGDSASMAAFEVKKNLHPIDALWQLISKQGRETLPVGKKGFTPFSVYAEKAMEGTLGMNAELMFRLLYVGDQPFRNSARTAAQFRVYAEDGGKQKFGSFDRFINSISKEQAKRVERMENETIFSEEGELYQIVDKALKGFSQAGDKMEEFTGKYISTAVRVLSKASLPYVKVPSNLVQRAVEYSMPVLPLYRSIRLARKGDMRRAGELFGRAMIGFYMINMIDNMFNAGVLTAGASGDDKDKRGLKYESAKPNSVNVTALRRWMAGTQDPENPLLEGDQFWDYNRFGMLGIVSAIRTEVLESIQDKYKQPMSEIDPATRVLEQFNGAINGSLEISFLQGMLNLKDEYRQNGFTGVVNEMLTSSSAIFIPNNWMVSTKTVAPYILTAKDESSLQTMKEKVSTRIFPHLEDNITGVYPIISMWGEPVDQTPKGRDPLMYQFFDITNSKRIEDPLSTEMWNLSQRMDDVPVSAPAPTVTLDGKRYKLTEQDYTYMQMVAGKYKRATLLEFINEEDWKNTDDETKFAMIKEVNDLSNEYARDYILSSIVDGVDEGKITLDEKLGKYSYTEPSEFDWDYWVDAME